MNERIKQLAVQAGFTGWTPQTTIGLELEKFAELIVRECANIQEGQHEAELILQHFGLE